MPLGTARRSDWIRDKTQGQHLFTHIHTSFYTHIDAYTHSCGVCFTSLQLTSVLFRNFPTNTMTQFPEVALKYYLCWGLHPPQPQLWRGSRQVWNPVQLLRFLFSSALFCQFGGWDWDFPDFPKSYRQHVIMVLSEVGFIVSTWTISQFKYQSLFFPWFYNIITTFECHHETILHVLQSQYKPEKNIFFQYI